MTNVVVQSFSELFATIGLPTVMIFAAVLLLSLWILSSSNPRVNWPPGPLCFPVVGCLPQLMISGKRRQPTDLLPWYDTYGDIMHIKLGEQHMIMLGTYELIEEAFVKNAATVSARPTWVYFLRQIVGKDGAGVLFKNGHAWKELRRFTLSSLRDFGLGRKSLQEKIQDEARYLVQSIEDENGKAFSPRDRVGKAVNNIISFVVFGARYDYDETPAMLPILEESLRMNKGGPLSFTNLVRFFLPKKKFALLDKFYSLVRQEVERHRQSFDPTDIRDFIDLYIKVTQDRLDPEIFTEWNVFRIIVDLYLAGTDTTANTLRWSLIHMVNHPDVQKRVQQEIDQVIGQGRVAKMEDKARMPFTEATILEVFRMSPVAPSGVPHATSEATTLAGYTIPKGTIILGDLYRVLHDKNNFEDPYKFKPERWLDDDGKVIKSDKMIPFSIGPRICLGKGLAEMESFIFFTTLLQNFTFKVPEGENPPSGVEGLHAITFSPHDYSVYAVRR
ncbi:cytochrome P450 2C15-like [Lingula anatina]|uniref:Cytochrome P450 2C15-like n=1 Tax=Lingula anatina TaxID=7574 RepID=A0A1S3KER4_LINAN|nr:cytochrome P450 2C15-like [Lingula anatina]|eukprot:XP_013420992.1 cytochrome P450 2C15-like [Lingula anatina]